MKLLTIIAAALLTLSFQAKAESFHFDCINEGQSTIAFRAMIEKNSATIQLNQANFGGNASTLKGRQIVAPFFEIFNSYSNYQTFVTIDQSRSLIQLVQLRFRNADLNSRRMRMLLEVAPPSQEMQNEGIQLTGYGMICTAR